MARHGGKSNTQRTSRTQATAWLVALAAAGLPLGCGDDDDSAGTGGKDGSGGKATASGGNASAGKASGGSSSGGSPSGGSAGKMGGSGSSSGGASSGGVSSGGASSGGNAAGGSLTGGVSGSAGEAGSGGDAGGHGGSGGDELGGMGPGGGGAAGGGGAGGADCGSGFQPEEWQAIQGLTPLPPVPTDSTNAYADNAGAATLGQKFFFEKGFSGPLADLGTGVVNDLGAAGESGKVACASCHSSVMMSDSRSPLADGARPANVSLGANFHTRNAPAMVNSSFYPWTNWGGRFAAQWELPMPVTESAVIMNSTRLRVAHVIFDKYKTEYEAVFGPAFGAMEPAIGSDAVRFPAAGKPKAAGGVDGPWELMADGDRAIINRIFVNYGKALAAYNRKLVSRNAAFDRFAACNESALTESAKNGLKLFVGQAGCVNCHSGPHLSDGLFHNIGVSQIGAHVPATDNGRLNDAPLGAPFSAGSTWSDDAAAGTARRAAIPSTMPESSRAAFRTPSLRGVAETAPYMHSGQLATLAEVVEFYARGGDTPATGSKELTPLNLTTSEKADLVNFLNALSGEAVAPALLVDTSQ